MRKVFFAHGSDSLQMYVVFKQLMREEGIQVYGDLDCPIATDWTDAYAPLVRQCDSFIMLVHKKNDDLINWSTVNSFFELGYAMGLGKNVLLLRSEGAKIPTHLSSLPVKTVDSLNALSVSDIADWVKQTPESEAHVWDTSHPFDLLQSLNTDATMLDAVPAREFEKLVAAVFSSLGFRVEQVSERSDLGYDLELLDEDTDLTIIVQVKKHRPNTRMSIGDVHRIVGATVVAQSAAAIIITTGSFTSTAQYMSDNSPIPVVLLTNYDLETITKQSILEQCRPRR